jgi:hypothetical protein
MGKAVVDAKDITEIPTDRIPFGIAISFSDRVQHGYERSQLLGYLIQGRSGRNEVDPAAFHRVAMSLEVTGALKTVYQIGRCRWGNT